MYADISSLSQHYRWTYSSPIVRYSSEDRSLEKEFITHVFFPFRFVEYKAVSQLTEGHPDNMPIGEETPVDQAKVDSLIRFLKERDCVLERDMVTFTYIKELHPSVNWRTVRSLLLSFNSLNVFISFDSFVSFPMLNMLCLGALWSQFRLSQRMSGVDGRR